MILSNQLSAKYVVEAFERVRGEVYLKVNITISLLGKQPKASLGSFGSQAEERLYSSKRVIRDVRFSPNVQSLKEVTISQDGHIHVKIWLGWVETLRS